MKSRGWLKRKRAAAANRNSHSAGLSRSKRAREISASLDENIAELHRIFTFTPDLVIRDFESSYIEGRLALVYLTGLVDKNSINNNVLRPLLAPNDRSRTSILDLLSVGKVTTLHDFDDVEEAILQGSVIGRNTRMATAID